MQRAKYISNGTITYKIVGDQGPQGPQGPKGDTGKSAYQIAVDNGFVGTESEWLASLKSDLVNLNNVVGLPITDEVEKISNWRDGYPSSVSNGRPNWNTSPYYENIQIDEISNYTEFHSNSKYQAPSNQGSMMVLLLMDKDGNSLRYLAWRSDMDYYSSQKPWWRVDENGYYINIEKLLIEYPTTYSLVFSRMKTVSNYSWLCTTKDKGIVKDVEELQIYSDKVEIVLPTHSVAVVGHEYNLYFKNALSCKNIDDYFCYCTLDNLSTYHNLKECFRYTPISSEVGNKTLTFYVMSKIDNSIVASKSLTLHIINDRALSGKKVLFIGDSLTENGYYAAEIQHRLSSGGIESLGTVESTVTLDSLYTVKHEGRSGWSAHDYVTYATTQNKNNAFWNPNTSKFDFSYYMSQQGYTSVDVVCINLGTNGHSNVDNQTTNAITEMINSIHDYNSDIKVLVSLITPSANQDGWYRTVTPSNEFATNRIKLIKKYMELYMDRSDNVDVTEPYFNIDTFYDFVTRKENVSSRTPIEVTRINNTVHPSKYGYLKMADVYYNNLLYWLTIN